MRQRLQVMEGDKVMVDTSEREAAARESAAKRLLEERLEAAEGRVRQLSAELERVERVKATEHAKFEAASLCTLRLTRANGTLEAENEGLKVRVGELESERLHASEEMRGRLAAYEQHVERLTAEKEAVEEEIGAARAQSEEAIRRARETIEQNRAVVSRLEAEVCELKASQSAEAVRSLMERLRRSESEAAEGAALRGVSDVADVGIGRFEGEVGGSGQFVVPLSFKTERVAIASGGVKSARLGRVGVEVEFNTASSCERCIVIVVSSADTVRFCLGRLVVVEPKPLELEVVQDTDVTKAVSFAIGNLTSASTKGRQWLGWRMLCRRKRVR
jgi:hypothetical protein